jgi:hypothetical protein
VPHLRSRHQRTLRVGRLVADGLYSSSTGRAAQDQAAHRHRPGRSPPIWPVMPVEAWAEEDGRVALPLGERSLTPEKVRTLPGARHGRQRRTPHAAGPDTRLRAGRRHTGRRPIDDAPLTAICRTWRSGRWLPACSGSGPSRSSTRRVTPMREVHEVRHGAPRLLARPWPARHRAFTGRAGKDADRYWS